MWKINDLGVNLNALDYMRIIYRLCADYIMYYLSPCPKDNRDNADVFFELKKMGPPYLEAPPP